MMDNIIPSRGIIDKTIHNDEVKPMDTLEALLTDIISSELLTQASISNVRDKQQTLYTKVSIKPVLIKDKLTYQFTYTYPQKVQHENMSSNDAIFQLKDLFQHLFKQGVLHTKEADYHVLISKKFKVTVLKKLPTKRTTDLTHNRKKQYILEEGTPVPFLIELGVMNPEGKVLAKKYDKFRQINRFLEMIDDIVPFLKKDKTLQIVDFGCGKSYLTFALYHYLKEMIGLNLNVIGLDLKKDVINHCNRLSQQLGYDNLRFNVGDISQYNDLNEVDMVVTLHACDTATDAALEKAVRWNADVILSVPCCQHEMYNQVQNEVLSPMLTHGIIKERFSALATDSVRAHLLDIVGYKTQILEFIDLEHTPKNLLIRAVKQSEQQDVEAKVKSYIAFKHFLQINPYLENALKDKIHPLMDRFKH